jgi:16S rRNA (guanine527-N7)-methyltransferase
MEADSFLAADKAAVWAGTTLSGEVRRRLENYHSWLATEGVRAGGLGPNERTRIWSRHIADSLLFGLALKDVDSCVDVGSGVGLPGIPLAIAYPEVKFDLVDRSGRRADLLRRASAVLGIRNCRVIHGDIKSVDNSYPALVSRASLPPAELMIHVKHLLEPAGVALVGLAHGREPEDTPETPPGLHSEVVIVPDDILDTPVSLLRIVAI